MDCNSALFNVKCVGFYFCMLLSLSMLIFCCVKLYQLDRCDQGPYLALITAILGIWFPSPKLPDNNVQRT